MISSIPLLLAALTFQEAPPGAGELRSLELWHEESVWNERLVELVEDFEGASAEARQRVLDAISTPRGARPRPGRRPEIEDLARLHRILEGADSDALDRDLPQRFADTIDLRIVPGAFPEVDEGRGRALEVWVRSLWHVPWRARLQVHLDWISPDGSRERVRSEPFGTESFAGRGFPMFIRSPLGPAGTWRLLPVLEVDGRFVEGRPAPVQAVEDLDFRMTLVDPEPPTWDEGHPPLRHLVHYGVRSASGASVSTWLEHRAGFPVERPFFAPTAAFDARLRPFALLSNGEESDRYVVQLTPEQERSETLDPLSLGHFSATFAEAGIACLSLELRRDLRQPLYEALGTLRAREKRVVLLARGDAVTTLHLIAGGGELEVDGLVLVSPVAPGPALPDVPTLWLRTSAAEGSQPPRLERTAELVLRSDPRPDWLLTPELPALVSAWVAGL